LELAGTSAQGANREGVEPLPLQQHGAPITVEAAQRNEDRRTVRTHDHLVQGVELGAEAAGEGDGPPEAVPGDVVDAQGPQPYAGAERMAADRPRRHVLELEPLLLVGRGAHLR